MLPVLPVQRTPEAGGVLSQALFAPRVLSALAGHDPVAAAVFGPRIDVTFTLDDEADVSDVTEDFALSGDISPAQITADQNDYNPTGLSTASTLRLTSDADWSITGLQGGADGRILILHNCNSDVLQTITLTDDDAASSAANRFELFTDLVLAGGQSVMLQYDATSSRWRALAQQLFADDGLVINDSIIAPDWSGLDANSGLADDDLLALYDTSAANHVKITAQELAAYLGAMHLLATNTASASSAIDFDFTDWTNSDYAAYLIVFNHVAPATDNVTLNLRTSTDGGSTFDAGASDYRWTYNNWSEGATAQVGDAADSEIELVNSLGNAANETTSGTILIMRPSDAQYGAIQWFVNGVTTDGATRVSVGGGRRVSAADVNAVRLLMSSGNIASGEFRIYGLPVTGVGGSGGGGGGGAGDLELLATATASASATVDFTLTGWTNSDYHSYEVRFSGVAPATDNVDLVMRTSTDGGSNYDAGAADYSYMGLKRNDTGATVAFQSGVGRTTEIALITGIGNAANEQNAGEVRIFNPSAAQYCRVLFEVMGTNISGAGLHSAGGGVRYSAGDVDAIRFLMSSGNIASGEFRLYGRRNA